MSYLYGRLQRANTAGRLAYAESLIAGMRGANHNANTAYYGVCEQIITDMGAQETEEDELLPRSEFPAANSALLVRSVPRVRGFLNAIARAPQAETIIDAGTGSSAILAVGAAVTHPRAKVIAYEINEPAVRCARTAVELLGLSNRISVELADVTTAALPEADLAITETFGAALLVEKGLEITEALARTSREILPAHGVIYACDERPSASTRWQHGTTVDFTAHNELITGEFRSNMGGERPVNIYAGYYDAREAPIITEASAVSNDLTNPVYLGSMLVSQAGTRICFGYTAGTELHEQPATLWVPNSPC